MDDWVVRAPTRWKLRTAIRHVNQILAELKVEQHPDKTFIGRISRGFDFLGYCFASAGLVGVAVQTVERFVERATRLYEQGADAIRIGEYVSKWLIWLRSCTAGGSSNGTIQTTRRWLIENVSVGPPLACHAGWLATCLHWSTARVVPWLRRTSHVRVRRLFRCALRVREEVLAGCALTNRFPSSRAGYYCSWDINDSKPVSLFIPSEGIQLLVEDLTKGKLFGYKLSILYSGRAMALWDFSALAGTALALGFFEHTKGVATASAVAKGVCGVLIYVLKPLMVALLVKFLFIDFYHWSSRYQKVAEYIRSKFKAGSSGNAD